MSRIDINAPYQISINGWEMPPFTWDDMKIMFSDGRTMGLIAERLVASMFDDLEMVTGDGPFDLIDMRDGRRFEVRCVTDRGFSVSPSAQRGAGRKIDIDAHLERLEMIDAFILVDIRGIKWDGEIRFAAIEPSQIPGIERGRSLRASIFDDITRDWGWITTD